MRFSHLASLLTASACLVTADVLKPRDYEKNDYFTLHLRSDQSPENIAELLNLQYEGKLGELDDHYTFFQEKGKHNAHETLTDLKLKIRKRELLPEGLENVLWSRKSELKPRLVKRGVIPDPIHEVRADKFLPGVTDNVPSKDQDAVAYQQAVANKLGIQDPIFNEQWHLYNTIQKGHDINVTGVWLEGNTGKNATVAIVDDGLDMYSDDLKANYYAEGSYDFNDHVEEPRPRLVNDHHGTRCAGEVAAVKNNVCGVGVAYDSKVSGLRILSKAISDEDEAVAINYQYNKNLIYSCSWGPPDNGQAMDAPNVLIKRAIQNGIQNGRNGLGSIFVFAAGNGAHREDNCNFDGYTNSIYSITVGAIDRMGQHPYYSEKCSASLVVAYSSGAGDAIHTTDVGTNNCNSNHGGTSAAAPLGAGIMALVLSARPDLNWRDLQYLCVETAVPINLDQDWQDTYIGKKYSHTFAYGKLDAYRLVEKAKTWKSVKPQAWYKTPWQYVRHDIPEGEQGLASTFVVTKDMLKQANVERLEHVQVTMNIEHTRRGDLSVDLISPTGVISHLSTTRRYDEQAAGYDSWTFMSVVHW
jgi:kexin